MSVKDVRKTDEFLAIAADGKTYRVFEFREFVRAETFEDPHGVMPGIKYYELENGHKINRRTETEFETLTGIKLTKKS